jgi:hypothetical protein
MSQTDHAVEAAAGSVGEPWPRRGGDGGDEEREEVLESYRRRRRFWIHCSAYLIVNGVLFTVWPVLVATSGPRFSWPIFPLAGWGLGLAGHAVATFDRSNPPITEAEICDELQRIRRR